MSQAFKLSSVLASLSHALDVTEGQAAGCSANAAPVANLFGSDDQQVKKSMKVTDWSGLASGARYMMCEAIRHLDQHWMAHSHTWRRPLRAITNNWTATGTRGDLVRPTSIWRLASLP